MIKRQQAGDTIVEVLIAIAIISTVLTGAFLVSRSSLKHVRESEEHGQALNLVQGQVEQLRAYAGTISNGDSLPATFCMASATSAVASTNAACTQGLYALYIIKDTAHNAYQVTAEWDSVNGDISKSKVQLAYRVAFKP
jgi:prepilin-type N-terminal cleavage/methylation domain-containing protein